MIRSVHVVGVGMIPFVKPSPEVSYPEMAASTLCPKRFGDADEFASLVAHIPENRYINADVLRIDGGARLN